MQMRTCIPRTPLVWRQVSWSGSSCLRLGIKLNSQIGKSSQKNVTLFQNFVTFCYWNFLLAEKFQFYESFLFFEWKVKYNYTKPKSFTQPCPQVTMQSPGQFLLFEFSIIMPAWHQLCIWMDPAGSITAYLDSEKVLDHFPVFVQDTFKAISASQVSQIWTNMETFRLMQCFFFVFYSTWITTYLLQSCLLISSCAIYFFRVGVIFCFTIADLFLN
jgi:hypothetical protein